MFLRFKIRKRDGKSHRYSSVVELEKLKLLLPPEPQPKITPHPGHSLTQV
jgi:hypothetical protein